jgi:hypothetical protein
VHHLVSQAVYSHSGAIDTGNITLAEFVRSFPYPADLVDTFELQGVRLLEMLEHSVSLANETSFDITQGIGRFLQVRVRPQRYHIPSHA